jgi:hypothetical protein
MEFFFCFLMLATRWKNLVFGYWMFPASGEMNWPDLAFNLVHGPHPIVEMYVFSCSVRKNDNPVCPLPLVAIKARPVLSPPWLAACSFVDLARRFVSFCLVHGGKSPLSPLINHCVKKVLSTFSYKCGIFSVSERHLL